MTTTTHTVNLDRVGPVDIYPLMMKITFAMVGRSLFGARLKEEDLVSQVFLDVWRTARQFEGRSQVSTWLLSISRFKALTALRQRRHEDIDQEDMLEIADEADTPEASLERSTTSAILRACVAKLSPAHREIINLVYYHEKSVEEVGAIIGIPQSTVKTRMFYARKQLADLLRGAGVDSLAA